MTIEGTFLPRDLLKDYEPAAKVGDKVTISPHKQYSCDSEVGRVISVDKKTKIGRVECVKKCGHTLSLIPELAVRKDPGDLPFRP